MQSVKPIVKKEASTKLALSLRLVAFDESLELIAFLVPVVDICLIILYYTVVIIIILIIIIIITWVAVCVTFCSRCAQWFVRGLRPSLDKEIWEYQDPVHLATSARRAGQVFRTPSRMTTPPMNLTILIPPTPMTAVSFATTTSIVTSVDTRVAKLPPAKRPLVNLVISVN